jgi:hypothetical protein
MNQPINSVAPLAQAFSNVTKAPKFFTSKNKKGVTIIEHREFVGNIYGSTNYQTTNYAIQPGVLATFPWLANIAQNFEQYKFTQFDVEYVTRSNTVASGTVLMAVDYDAADLAPASETVMATYEDTVEFVPWQGACLKANIHRMCAPGAQSKYIRSAMVPSTDIKTYDGGNVFVATTGTNTGIIGKLWIRYRVELMVPQAAAMGNVLTSFLSAASPGFALWQCWYGPYVPLGILSPNLVLTAANNTQCTGLLTWGASQDYSYVVSMFIDYSVGSNNTGYLSNSFPTNMSNFNVIQNGNATSGTGTSFYGYYFLAVMSASTDQVASLSLTWNTMTGTIPNLANSTLFTIVQVAPGSGFYNLPTLKKKLPELEMKIFEQVIKPIGGKGKEEQENSETNEKENILNLHVLGCRCNMCLSKL